MRRSWTRLLLLLAAVAAVFVGTALATAQPGDPAVFPARPQEPSLAIFQSHNGYHAELALPAAFVSGQRGATADALSHLRSSPWVLVGWGDARFYMGTGWSLRRIRDGLRALWPDNPAVLRLTPLDRSPDQAFERGVLRIEISERGAQRLLRRLDRSFQTAGGRTIPLAAGQSNGSAVYFQSVERFSVGRLCNNWVGQLLNAAGVPTLPALHALPQGLEWDIRRRLPTGPAPEPR
jgi:hypothetical protein